jgi:hypothetical protein
MAKNVKRNAKDGKRAATTGDTMFTLQFLTREILTAKNAENTEKEVDLCVPCVSVW